MKEKLKKQDTGFAQIKHDVSRDKNLSWKAKGIFGYLYGLPDDWDFSGDRIVEDGKDGRKSVYAGLKELQKRGYLVRRKKPDGKMEYFVKYTREEEKPDVQNGQEAQKAYCPKGTIGQEAKIANTNEKSQLPKRGSIYNKEFINITNIEDTLKGKTLKFIEDLKEIFKGATLTHNQAEELMKFGAYWTEPNKSRTKIKWELEKTWDMNRRITTWFGNAKIFNKSVGNKYQAGKI